ncbi:hypothetical protein FO519_003973 [Halicephalobus sp. NKZ332]|nr:hypothetical protein FO519_003973 [Halicephalobus sp. NKZ332]
MKSQEAYLAWKDETKIFFDFVIDEHKRKNANLSTEAKVADDTLLNIIMDMDLTPQQKCEQIVKLSSSLSDTVREEARITTPKDCTKGIQ